MTARQKTIARSAAAKKGWQRKRARQKLQERAAKFAALQAPDDPNPWVGIQAFTRSLWQRATGWLR